MTVRKREHVFEKSNAHANFAAYQTPFGGGDGRTTFLHPHHRVSCCGGSLLRGTPGHSLIPPQQPRNRACGKTPNSPQTRKITVGSLFSGIGGLELGLERTGGFQTIWFSEIEPYPSAVLKKHWPEVPNLGDITKVNWDAVEKPDMLAGGFPCQDISVAGKGKGIREGTRSGLWSEYAKAIRILRPKYALIENVPELANRGLDIVLADLAEMGYDAEWGLLSASAVGALHRRERFFCFAHADRIGHVHGGAEIEPTEARKPAQREPQPSIPTSDANSQRCGRGGEGGHRQKKDGAEMQGRDSPCVLVADTDIKRKPRLWKETIPEFKELSWGKDIRGIEDFKRFPDIPEPLLHRKDYGLSRGVDRIECLGNAVVPQVAETIGYWILDFHTRPSEAVVSITGQVSHGPRSPRNVGNTDMPKPSGDGFQGDGRYGIRD